MLLLPDYRVRQRDYLLEISRAMTAKLNLDEVLTLILEAAVSMLSGQVGLIALHNGDRSFRTRATIGVDPDHVPLFAPLLEDITDDTRPGFDLTSLNRKMRSVARSLDMSLRQVVALPMIIHEEMVGVIFVFRAYSGEASANDLSVLQSFADQAAIAVQNARLVNRITEERGRLAAVLDHSGDGIMILDMAGQILRFNKALERITGWNAQNVIGRQHDTVIAFQRIDQGRPLGVSVAEGWPTSDSADTLYVEGDLQRLDGGIIGVGITYAFVNDPRAGYASVVANVRDISNFRKAQEMKSTFISVISHELKTPVALIKGYAGTLRREDVEWDSATIQRSLTVIEEEADRLNELIENLLAASKLQAEGMRLTLGDVNLRAVAARSVERFQTQTTKHTLVLDFPKNFPVIQGDEVRLRQVIDNLLNNAIKYSPNGGTIRVTGKSSDGMVSVAVSDQGVGLNREDQEHIFERFFRADDALSRKTQGTGLGLYLAKAVIDAHNGTIEVESQPGKGSIFRFSLPSEK
jgi:PAS domain S-box-containing protein